VLNLSSSKAHTQIEYHPVGLPETSYQARRQDVLDLYIKHLHLDLAAVRKENAADKLFVTGLGTAALTLMSIGVVANPNLGGFRWACAALLLVTLVCSRIGTFRSPPRLWSADGISEAIAQFRRTQQDTDACFASTIPRPIVAREQLIDSLIAEINLELIVSKRSAEWISTVLTLLLLVLILAVVGLATSS
jgi:hypothetical protein